MARWRLVALALIACALSCHSVLGGDAQVFPIGLEDVSQLNHTLDISSYVTDSQELLGNISSSCSKAAPAPARTPDALMLQHFREEDDWKNSLCLPFLSQETRAKMPRVVTAWLRCYVMVNVVYFLTGGLWAYYVYICWGDKFFAPGNMPALKDMLEQIKVSMLSMPLYSLLPAVAEHCVEQGWTKSYSRISDVGVMGYLAYFVLYMTCVEFCVYWMHRGLHDVKIGYKLLHYIHHKYNKEHTLSPFAGLAFHPLDGVLQGIPYCYLLFLVPMHFLTFELLMFATGVWTTNIHDCIHAKIAPVMGAGYHSLHHTVYNKNYGHYFTYMDKLHNTLFTPEEDEEQRQQRRK